MENNNRLQLLDKAPVGKLLWQYSLPAVVGMVVMQIYNIVDSIFIGQSAGPDALAGLAITFPVMNVSVAFGVLIGAGASARTSILLGAHAKDKAEQVLGNSLVMTLVFGTFYVGMFALLMNPVLRLFGASDASLPYAYSYMMWALPSLIFNNLTFSFNNIMRASGYPNKAMVTMFIGAGLNVVLDPIFIFGMGMGIKGAALATDISMAISMAFVMLHFFSKKSEVHFQPGIYKLRKDILLPILAIGAAPCVVNSANCVINAIINNSVLAYGGDLAVASIGIFIRVTGVVVPCVIGVCMGMQPIVGYNYGAKRFDRLRRAYWLTAAVCTVVCVMGTLVCQLFPAAISRLFTSDEQLIAASVTTLRITTAMFWLAGFQIAATNFFQSIGEAGKSIFMSLTRQVLFFLPMLFVLPTLFGLNGVWMSYPVSDLIAAVCAAVLLAMQMRKIARLGEAG